ncbi:MAG TPA: LytTR family DNA-binding domain-containing protein [Burkholderiales bacterium]|nr:LytTR family DNA-binding domain-containing protein [Burkholderiales bacterium]
MSVTVLVVDDEPLARRKLAALIQDVPWAKQVGEAHDGMSALEAIARLRPDIVLLDIQMPELTGIQVVERLRRLQLAPVIVFTTAYDQYAVTAFELEAVDYLLKPFGATRFLTALERSRHAVGTQEAFARLERASVVLSNPSSAVSVERIFVRDGSAVVPLALSAIERFEAQDDYVMIHSGNRNHLVSLRVSTLEARLPNPPFLRVHRSHIVNLDHVDRMVPLDDSRLEVRMKSGAKVPVSRVRSQEIRRRAR